MPYSKGEHPFVTKKQKGFMFANHPKLAKEMAHAAKKSGVSLIGKKRKKKKSFTKKK
jgi:hypothetical protein